MNAPQQMSVDELAEQLALRASRKCADGYSVPFDSDLDQAAASALSSQSLSLSEAREENERLRKSERKAVDDLCRWRAAFQSFTPGGSEFFDPKAVREWAEGLKTQVFEANKRAVLAERKVLENSKARLADAPSKSPDPDLSSLRKGAEEPCPHAPTYDAGLCCGHPDDCTFVQEGNR